MPEKLGRYEILEKLGQGGFAAVYRARDTTLEREVALKELQQGLLQDADTTKRFIREARTIARLNHPRIVSIYDILELDERLIIVMRLVDGPSLDRLITEQGSLPWSQALEIIRSMVGALDYAHAQGILHRDLKPANILLDPERGPQLTDFGLAKLAGDAGASVTAAGGIVGTAQYIAPEVWEAQGTTRQSDIYALGCILYEMLTGQPLFGGNSPPAIMMAHFSPLTLPDDWPEGVPAGLPQVLTTALAKAPGDRYATAGDLAAALIELAEPVSEIVVDNQLPPQPRQDERPTKQPSIQNRLPVQTTPFVGREAELAELTQLLNDPNVRLVTILAPGGMGKSRLSLETAQAQSVDYTNGVCFVALAPIQTAADIVPAIAAAVGYPFQRDERSAEQQLLNYFRTKELLLVLDNFEHVLDGAGLVNDILQAAPAVKILITSRERLKLSGETVFILDGMDFPKTVPKNLSESPADALDYSAVKLFMQSARRARPEFELVADDLEVVARICRVVQGMPLGILLAAAWVEMLSPQEIAQEIGQSLDFLETDLRDVPERQHSIRAVFDYSWLRLTSGERAVFMKLSLFRGGMTRDAAQRVAMSGDGSPASLRLLAGLVNKSLLRRNPDGRYEIHELLRQYAQERLERSGQNSAARDAHCTYYIEFLSRREVELKGAGQQLALAEIEQELENVRLAWGWTIEQGQVEQIERALESLALFYHWRGRCQEGEAICGAAADKLMASTRADDLRVLSRLLTWQSEFYFELGKTEAAGHLLKQSLSLLDQPELAGQDTRSERAFALLKIGYLSRSSDLKEAKRLHQQSLALYRALDDSWGQANALSDLSDTVGETGGWSETQRLQRESLEIRKRLGDQRGVAATLGKMAEIALLQGQSAEGQQLARESHTVLLQIGDQASFAQGFSILGAALTWGGNFAEGQAFLEKGLFIYEDLGLLESKPGLDVSCWLGNAYTHLGQYKEARSHLQTVLNQSRDTGIKLQICSALFDLQKVLHAEGAYLEAQELLLEDIAICRELRIQNSLAIALAHFGYITHKLGNEAQTRQCLGEALQIGLEIRAFNPILMALPAIALLLADQGKQELAVEITALAWRHPYIANSRFYEDIAGRHLASVADTIPPEVVTAAQERGQARDVWATAAELLAKLG